MHVSMRPCVHECMCVCVRVYMCVYMRVWRSVHVCMSCITVHPLNSYQPEEKILYNFSQKFKIINFLSTSNRYIFWALFNANTLLFTLPVLPLYNLMCFTISVRVFLLLTSSYSYISCFYSRCFAYVLYGLHIHFFSFQLSSYTLQGPSRLSYGRLPHIRPRAQTHKAVYCVEGDYQLVT